MVILRLLAAGTERKRLVPCGHKPTITNHIPLKLVYTLQMIYIYALLQSHVIWSIVSQRCDYFRSLNVRAEHETHRAEMNSHSQLIRKLI